MTVLVIYPEAGGGGSNTSCDGSVSHGSVGIATGETFATIIAAADNLPNGSVGTGAATEGVQLYGATPTDRFHINKRAFASFDTSALSGATISAAEIGLYGSSKVNTLGDMDIHIAGSSQANANNLTGTDYAAAGGTSFGSKAYSVYSTSAYNDITLNAAGISNIDTEGVSKFSMKSGWDINESFTGTWAGWANSSQVLFVSSDAAGTTQDPKLTITFTLPDPPTVTTQAATSITQTGATFNGNIAAEGDATPTTRGFAYTYSTTGDPTIADNTVSESGTFGTGAFSLNATDLTASTHLRVAAFATSTEGTGYGETVDVQLLGTEHPAGDFHNGAESKILQTATNTALKTADGLIATAKGGDGFWYTAAGVAIPVSHDDIDYNYDDTTTSYDVVLANATEDAKNKITTYESARTVEEVEDFHSWAGNGKLLIDVDGNTLLDVDGNPLFSA